MLNLTLTTFIPTSDTHYTTIISPTTGAVFSAQDCYSRFRTQCQCHLQTANKVPDPAVFQLSNQPFIPVHAVVVNHHSQFNRSAEPPGLNSKLQKQYFTANHTLMEQMACSEIKQAFNSSKTKLTETRGIFWSQGFQHAII